MATYKVLQDIEAEDKLFGPFTLKQFIFGGVTAVIIFILFQILVSPLPIFLKAPLVFVFIPPLSLFGFMAAPISRDQPNDIWLLARLRFLFKPRTRIWSQDGISELVTITAPKQDTHVYTNSISQTEVKSRLQALANTVDTRGWATKNVNTNLFTQPDYISSAQSDRLIDAAELPQDTAIVNVTAADDVMDPLNNSTAQHLDQLIQASTAAHKQQAIAQMTTPAPQPATPAAGQDYYFMNQPQPPSEPLPTNYATFDASQVVQPGANDVVASAQSTAEEDVLAHKLREEKQQAVSHIKDRMKVVTPLHDQDGNLVSPTPLPQAIQARPAPVQQSPNNPALQQLSQNNDLNISTIARQAKQAQDSGDDSEVVISLH